MIINRYHFCSLRLSTDKQKGFDFNGYQTLDVVSFNKFTENKEHLQENHLQEQQAELPAEGTAITTINIHHQPEEVNEEAFNYSNIRDLIQDDKMFRLDSDPTFFDSMSIEDNLNNNLGLDQIKDLASNYSDSWISAPADFEIFSDLPDNLFESDMMEKKEEQTPPSSPIPAPPSPVVEAVEVKTENTEFDLIKYIIFGEVSSNEIENFLRSF